MQRGFSWMNQDIFSIAHSPGTVLTPGVAFEAPQECTRESWKFEVGRQVDVQGDHSLYVFGTLSRHH
jgi:hypothetical protein